MELEPLLSWDTKGRVVPEELNDGRESTSAGDSIHTGQTSKLHPHNSPGARMVGTSQESVWLLQILDIIDAIVNWVQILALQETTLRGKPPLLAL